MIQKEMQVIYLINDLIVLLGWILQTKAFLWIYLRPDTCKMEIEGAHTRTIQCGDEFVALISCGKKGN